LLIGTKCDLRNDNTQAANLISKEEGAKLAKEIGSVCYMECSALTQENLKNVFDEAVRAAINYEKQKKKKKQACYLL